MLTGKKGYWIFQLFGWGAFFLLHLFFAWFYGKLETDADRQLFIARSAGFVLIGFIVTHFMRIIILKFEILSKKPQQQIAAFFLLTLVMAFVCGLIEHNVFSFLHILSPREAEIVAKRGSSLVALGNALSWFAYIFCWNSIYLLFHYTRDYRQQQIDTLQLKSLVKELELKTIKSHINPHFIFNSLNSIRALVDEDPERARTAITELSNILRSSINIHKNETVLLKDELNIVEDYLALEHMRFEDRLHVQYNIDNDTLENLVPPMMLQILVENAIKHGISREVKGGLVKISAQQKNNLLELCVENTGQLNGNNTDSGFGVKSTNERLHLLYGDKGNFEIRQLIPNIVQAKLMIPVSS